MSDTSEQARLVWDLPLRLFHWLLVLSLTTSYITAKLGFDWRPTHMRLGYFTIGLVLFRIIWGFIGPRHARFVNFLSGPSAVWRYAKGMASGTMLAQSVGHNPLGGLMVVAMLVLVAIQTATGLFTSDDIVYAGPYNGAVSDAMAKTLGHVHHVNFNIILGAVGLHITAIAFYAFKKKHNLVPAMVTGEKPAALVPAHEAITNSQLIKALVSALVCAGLVYWLIQAAPVAAAGGSYN